MEELRNALIANVRMLPTQFFTNNLTGKIENYVDKDDVVEVIVKTLENYSLKHQKEQQEKKEE